MNERDPFKMIVNDDGEIVKGGCVVLDEAGRYLLVTHPSKESWGLPKGHTEPGESIEESALRETEEETGYKVERVKALPPLTYIHGETGQPIRVCLWQARVVGRTGKDAEERYDWFSYEDVMKMVFPNVAEYLEKTRSELVIK